LGVDSCLNELQILRYPESSRRDKQAEFALKKYRWPQSSQVRWLRQGDRSGIEIKLFISHPQELRKVAEHLLQLHKQLETNSDSPWTTT
jgi:hypothetical protein